MPLLDVDAITVRFGGSLALNDVSMSAEPGQVTGLIGPNGAGKTTMFNVISGLQPPDDGKIVLDGARHHQARAPPSGPGSGLARTFQRLELFTMLTVRENIRVAADIHRGWARTKVDPAAQVDEIIDRVGLAEVADLLVTAVPTGQARLVELARALACEPAGAAARRAGRGPERGRDRALRRPAARAGRRGHGGGARRARRASSWSACAT